MIVAIENHPSFKALSSEVRQLSPDRKADLTAALGGVGSEERMLTVEDIADVLDVHPVTVRRWIRSGELKATRIRGYRVNPIDLSDFLKQRGIPMKRESQKTDEEVT